MKGIRKTPHGWQVFIRVNGQYKSRRLPAATTPRQLEDERKRLEAEIKFGVAPKTEARTFSQDADAYLELVKAMPSYADRAYRIGQWVLAFGHRERSTITARDIRTQLEAWRLSGSHSGGPLTPASLNQRRTALMHLYTVLDGKSAANIVRDVPGYDERYSLQARAESMLTCVRLIRRLRHGGKMRTILYVLLWTGWPHKLLKGVKPGDIDWEQSRVRVGRRHKGKGMAPAWVPVVPRALIGLRRMEQRKWFGDFSNSSLHSALERAVASENTARARRRQPLLADFNPYALRHSFATWAASKIKDDRALKELIRSNSIHRYTEGAVADRLQSAVNQLAPPVRPKVVTGNFGNSTPSDTRKRA